jgi:hypothetical protein
MTKKGFLQEEFRDNLSNICQDCLEIAEEQDFYVSRSQHVNDAMEILGITEKREKIVFSCSGSGGDGDIYETIRVVLNKNPVYFSIIDYISLILYESRELFTCRNLPYLLVKCLMKFIFFLTYLIMTILQTIILIVIPLVAFGVNGSRFTAGRYLLNVSLLTYVIGISWFIYSWNVLSQSGRYKNGKISMIWFIIRFLISQTPCWVFILLFIFIQEVIVLIMDLPRLLKMRHMNDRHIN